MPSGIYPRQPLAERFWEKVDKRGPSECWLWTGAVMGQGYGHITNEGQQLRAHRVAWELTFGTIPEGMCILHHCDNKLCVNPKHLFIGTIMDNYTDMFQKGHSEIGGAGERHPNARLTAKQVLEIRRRYAEGNVTQRELADEYGIATQSHISNIIHGHSWKHLREGI